MRGLAACDTTRARTRYALHAATAAGRILHSNAGHAPGSSLVMLNERSAPWRRGAGGSACAVRLALQVAAQARGARAVLTASPLNALALTSDSRLPMPLNTLPNSAPPRAALGRAYIHDKILRAAPDTAPHVGGRAGARARARRSGRRSAAPRRAHGQRSSGRCQGCRRRRRRRSRRPSASGGPARPSGCRRARSPARPGCRWRPRSPPARSRSAAGRTCHMHAYRVRPNLPRARAVRGRAAALPERRQVPCATQRDAARWTMRTVRAVKPLQPGRAPTQHGRTEEAEQPLPSAGRALSPSAGGALRRRDGARTARGRAPRWWRCPPG
jgi:hypothetical protein